MCLYYSQINQCCCELLCKLIIIIGIVTSGQKYLSIIITYIMNVILLCCVLPQLQVLSMLVEQLYELLVVALNISLHLVIHSQFPLIYRFTYNTSQASSQQFITPTFSGHNPFGCQYCYVKSFPLTLHRELPITTPSGFSIGTILNIINYRANVLFNKCSIKSYTACDVSLSHGLLRLIIITRFLSLINGRCISTPNIGKFNWELHIVVTLQS